MPVEKITGVVKDYAWGSPGGIDTVRGLPSSGQIQAEWWLGDHPSGHATLTRDARPLSVFLHDHGYRSLGFLLKVLTPATPLSLQVHPTTAQAERGFDAEEQEGIPIDSPTRVYKDRSAKPEVVVCVTGVFDALAGNAPDDVVLERIDRLVGAGLNEQLAGRWRDGVVSNRQDTVSWLLGGDTDARELVAVLGGVASADPLLSLLWSHYPGDAGCAVAMMLNRVSLMEGEALFLDAGQPHAYLSGVAVELMAPSDNVLRGGLTPKHIDIDQLVSIASFDPSPPPRLHPINHGDGWLEYQPGSEDFRLHRVNVPAGGERVAIDLVTPSVSISIDGGALVSVDGVVTELAPGEAAVIAGPRPHSVVEVLPGSAIWIADKR
jgi:mannose-6-phosphate isomerase